MFYGLMFFIFVFFFSFNYKLFSLLILEGMMILIIYSYFYSSFDLNSFTFVGLMIFCIFLVLDSILGLSNLISASRSSTIFNFFFFSF